MRFIETSIFTGSVVDLLNDEEYWALQRVLLARPELGPVISRSGGLRKLRWSRKGQGKRGGLRVIYYWNQPSETYYMLFV